MISWKLTQGSKGSKLKESCDSNLSIADGNTTHIKRMMEIELLLMLWNYINILELCIAKQKVKQSIMLY